MEFITPADAKAKLDAGGVLLVDIRSDSEYNAAHIPGAVLIPNAKLEPQVAQHLDPKETIFYCSSGMRTRANAETLKNAGFACSTCIDGGLEAWRSAGLPVTGGDGGAAISLARQVQLTVGVLLLIFSVLSFTISPKFVIGAAFIGAGLSFAGLTGTCALARILMLMPWNRPKQVQQTGGIHAHG